jgi:hypothetical protein
MFNDRINRFVLAFFSLMMVGLLYNRYDEKTRLSEEEDNYKKIREYLLNDSSIAKSKNPTMWIHVPYKINARQWKSFGSRNTTDLNQPYLSVCVRSLIDKCGKDFNICLIDDDSFAKLVPDWIIDMSRLPEPIIQYVRYLGLCKLILFYGGMITPVSFLCTKNLNNMYQSMTSIKRPFFIENLTTNSSVSVQTKVFPSFEMFGCLKNNDSMKQLIRILEENLSRDVTQETIFLGQHERFLYDMLQKNEITMVDGRIIGVKDIENKTIPMEDLFSQENNCITLHKTNVGILIPRDDILKRTKYNWLVSLNVQGVLESDFYLARQLKLSLD